jgi:hypothetical protein
MEEQQDFPFGSGKIGSIAFHSLSLIPADLQAYFLFCKDKIPDGRGKDGAVTVLAGFPGRGWGGKRLARAVNQAKFRFGGQGEAQVQGITLGSRGN